jgi:hypothetical protein
MYCTTSFVLFLGVVMGKNIAKHFFVGMRCCGTEDAQYRDLCVGFVQVGRREIRCHRRPCDSRPQHL